MKKIIIALACMLLGITGMQAQEFTLEYRVWVIQYVRDERFSE